MNDLEKTKRELEEIKQADENKSEIISVTAHQLRTSLSALKWILKMFMSKDFGEMNEEQKSYMEKAIESNERAVTLVNYLLTFNNADNMFETITLKEVDMLKLVDDVIAIFYGELKNKNIKLNLDKDGLDQAKVQGDKEMISVVIQNLIENAIKYSFENAEILVSIKKDEERDGITLSFHNNGIGIKKEDQAKIFNKFFRAPNAVAKENIGSGLGLFTSRNIVEKHGGKIWFESEEDTGTTFFVFLPLS